MKKIYSMLSLAGVLMIAAILCSPARAREVTMNQIRVCHSVAGFVRALAEGRDKGATSSGVHTEVQGMELESETLRPLYHDLVDAIFAAKQASSAAMEEAIYANCLKNAAAE